MFYHGRTNKYGNKWTEYNGQKYQSMAEAAEAADLDIRLRAHDIQSWTRQVPIKVQFYGELIFKYRIDFEVLHNNGERELIEVKGYEDKYWKLRWKILEIYCKHELPGVKLTIVKR